MPFYQIERFNPPGNKKGIFYDFIYGGVLYNKDNLPKNIYVSDYYNNSSNYRKITPVSSSISILTGSSTGTYIGFSLSAYFPDTPTGVNGNDLGEKYISGKYRLHTDISYPIKMSNATVNVKYSLGGVNYIAMVFPSNYNNTVAFNFSSPLAYVIYSEDVYNVGGYTTYPEFNANLSLISSPSIELFNTSLGNYILKDNYKNTIIDFGDIPQLVPGIFADWLNNIADVVYPNTYTIKSQNGDEVYTSLKEAPSMTNALISVIGNQKTLTFTGFNGQDYILTWNSETPDGKQFLGLSTSPNSTKATIPVNVSTQISFTTDTILYEVYGRYKPIATPFNINLYQKTCENNRVDKTNYITQVGTLSGVLREESSITDVTITFTSDNIPTFNYVYIEAFNRYYYVNDITSLKKDLWQMTLSVDVLMSYKEAILACTGFVDRNENEFNADLIDKKRVVEEGNTIEVATVTNELFTATQGTYLLNGILVSVYNKGS